MSSHPCRKQQLLGFLCWITVTKTGWKIRILGPRASVTASLIIKTVSLILFIKCSWFSCELVDDKLISKSWIFLFLFYCFLFSTGCITCWCPCMTFGQIAEIVDKGSSCTYSIWMNGGELITVLCVVLPSQKKKKIGG